MSLNDHEQRLVAVLREAGHPDAAEAIERKVSGEPAPSPAPSQEPPRALTPAEAQAHADAEFLDQIRNSTMSPWTELPL